MSLIATDNHFGLMAMLLGIVAAALWAEKTKVGKIVSGTLLTILLGLLLSNLRVIPFKAPAYDFVSTYPLLLAIPLLLFRADLRQLLQEGGKVLAAFCIGAVGSVVGVFVSASLLDIGEMEAKISGMFAGSFIGGSMNFVAVKETVEMNDEALTTVALAADNLSSAFVMMILISLPALAFTRRFFNYDPANDPKHEEASAGDLTTPHMGGDFSLPGLALSLAVSAGLLALSTALAEMWDLGSYMILLLTALSLVVANFLPGLVTHMRGDYDMGVFFMFLFFVVIGAGADIGTLIDSGLTVFAFMIIAVTIHLIIVLLVGRAFNIGLPEIMTGSNACVLGPTTAMAVAASRGWNHLILPAVLSGVFGYAIGTFIGFGVYQIMS